MKSAQPGRDSTVPLLWALLLLSAVGIVVAITMIIMLQQRDAATIDTYYECKSAGGAIAESYPEQCFLDGKSFVNDVQRVGEPDEYIKLTEQEAFAKADQAGVPRRVVERDGESLPVTMDYVPGRLNFYVKDGEVYKVNVEGE